MMTKKLMVGAALLLATSAGLLALQRGRGGPGGGLPGYYTNKSVPLGAADTAAPDRACQADKGHARLVCLADLLEKDLSPELLPRLQLPYSVADARRWSNFPPMGYRNRVGPTL